MRPLRRAAGVGFFLVPPVGANVWVEFEAGDPDYPIWTGCFWGPGEVPAPAAAVPQMKVLKTDAVTLTINDLPGAAGFTLEVSPRRCRRPMKLVCDADGIELSQRRLERQADPRPAVIVNNGALEVI